MELWSNGNKTWRRSLEQGRMLTGKRLEEHRRLSQNIRWADDIKIGRTGFSYQQLKGGKRRGTRKKDYDYQAVNMAV